MASDTISTHITHWNIILYLFFSTFSVNFDLFCCRSRKIKNFESLCDD